MKLSTRTRYGIRAVVELAGKYGEGPVQIKSIAEHQGISVKYLEQLMATMKSAGIVRSFRGSKGGYKLTKAPREIKLSEVCKVLEGEVITTQCVENESLCDRSVDCVTRKLWSEVQAAIENVLDSRTLQDLVDMAGDEQGLNYQI